MIKDRILKLKLLRYFVQRYWYPQLEVDVLSKERVSAERKIITDVDVLGLFPEVGGNLNLILGDCKTLKNQSPIARSLWMKGLMEYLDAPKGIIILQKDIEKDHQLTSNYLEIQLLSEQDFEVYSKNTVSPVINLNSALCEGENWDVFFEIEKRFPSLRNLTQFAKTDFWNISTSSKLRRSLYVLRSTRRELNPTNGLHLALVLNHFSLVAIALNDLVNKLFHRYLLPKTKQELDDDLKLIIWGGVENYNYFNDLRKRFTANLDAVNESDLSLPQWDKFLELIRLFLENPLALNLLPIFMKENAFAYLAEKGTHDYAKHIASQNQRITLFAIQLTSYLVNSCGLPPEFLEIYSSQNMSISEA